MRHRYVLLATLAWATPQLSHAQGYIRIEPVFLAPTEVRLDVTVTDVGTTAGCTQMILYRRRIEFRCGPSPLPVPVGFFSRVPGTTTTHHFTDHGVTPSTYYTYFISDCSVQFSCEEDSKSVPAYHNVATPPGPVRLAKGDLVTDPSEPGDHYIHVCGCPSFGRLPLESWPPEAVPYFNSGTEVVIFGRFSSDGCVTDAGFVVTGVQEESCFVAVQPNTWGQVKNVFR